MRIREVLIISGVLALTACNSTKENNEEALAYDDSKLYCEYRSKLGTNIKKRVCLTAAQKRQQKEDNRNTQKILNNMRTGNTWSPASDNGG
ncbi:hypothetical protein [Pseudoalteromonas rubra]|uniref:hypothetical protein n=1 Tax=Pseudoalteromonas rubra TaxID=43658 RepID=UPI000F77CBF7|nr:hypothetical protein [Pseudoalteromonas rubra]